MKPTVIIIGRPNVGKSTLFNRLVGKKLALVDDQPGVTRDRRFGDATIAGLEFTVVDTAGWEDEDAETLPGRMRRQTEVSVEGADAALFVIDARAGLTPLDEEIARWLRTQEIPVVAVANKAEGSAGDAGLLEAFSLGFGEPVALSAEHGEGVADLFDALWPIIGEKAEGGERDGEENEDEEAGPLKLAIVGRPNAGKSTLINRLLGEDRLLTGPEAGITRDSIAVDWQWTDPDGTVRDIRLIDTAGMRKRSNVVEKLEKLSVADAKRAIDFAEVVVLLLDATRGLEHQDLKIASMVLEEGRALMIAINKWDMAGSEQVGDASRLFNGIKGALDEGLAQARGLPLFAVSAKTGKGLDQMLKAAFEIREAWSKRVPTAALNRWFDDALEANPPPAPKGKRIKLRYITQAGTRPPRFVVFGTRLDMLPKSYERYLVNGIRKELGFDAVPVRVVLKAPKNPYAKG
ncbi:ribosome biogenesis GTPase Der [Tsuneonella sp. YG55]|uniref:GTPase Der n=1 Tax=Tsuneonella litorea TaxID=2976475 RepID=A0A9X2W1H4_9SPHN|nr:ribosome biogenesis GTPase Der [Tsuneonella litorea]MCT2558898.1 ribosome biogenesis GTPase Der [Tsuneonella litorea]